MNGDRNQVKLTMQWDAKDKAALVELAKHLQRSQTDTVRVLVREALRAIQGAEVTLSAPAANERKS